MLHGVLPSSDQDSREEGCLGSGAGLSHTQDFHPNFMTLHEEFSSTEKVFQKLEMPSTSRSHLFFLFVWGLQQGILAKRKWYFELNILIPCWDDSVSSIWVEEKGSKKSFLTEIETQMVTGIINKHQGPALLEWHLACSGIFVYVGLLSLVRYLKQVVEEKKRTWSPRSGFKCQCCLSLAVTSGASHSPSLSPREFSS